MALNLDTTFKLKAKVEGARSVQDFKKQLTGLDKSSKMSKAQLGKMNIEINRMARAAGGADGAGARVGGGARVGAVGSISRQQHNRTKQYFTRT